MDAHAIQKIYLETQRNIGILLQDCPRELKPQLIQASTQICRVKREWLGFNDGDIDADFMRI